jgi:catechol 1,2-dioxygenase
LLPTTWKVGSKVASKFYSACDAKPLILKELSMNRQEIDALVKQINIDTATANVNPRIQQIVVRLVADLFQAIDDLDISQTELWKGLEYFTDAGQANELGLLAAGLGLEHFLDLRADEADAKAGITGGTPRTIEGPLYVAGAPGSVGFARMDDGSEVELIDTLLIEGTVTDHHGNLIPNAKVEIWHANRLGSYSFFDKSQADFNLRRTILTDANGKYVAQTTMPVGYGCPPQGTTQALLNHLGRHGNRPSHVHYFVSAPGYRKLTTQFNIEGDQYLWDDFAFATREGLVATAVDITDEAEIARYGLNKAFKKIEFNIQLIQTQDQAPSTEVIRRRASA